MTKKRSENAAVHEFSFHAAVYKVQSLVDNGIRITLDLPETEIATAAILMECQRMGIPLLMVAKADTT